MNRKRKDDVTGSICVEFGAKLFLSVAMSGNLTSDFSNVTAQQGTVSTRMKHEMNAQRSDLQLGLPACLKTKCMRFICGLSRHGKPPGPSRIAGVVVHTDRMQLVQRKV